MRAEADRAYIYLLACAAIAVLAGWLYLFGFSFDWAALGVALILTLSCALSRRFPLRFGRAEVDVADIAKLTSLVLLGPIWAVMVAVPTMLYKDRLRTVFVSACDVMAILAAGYTLQLFANPLFTHPQINSSIIYGIMAAGAVLYALDALINSVLMRLKYGAHLTQTLKESFLPLVPADIAAILAALGTAYVMVAFGPAAALVLFAGAAAALISLHLIHKYQRESEELKRENAELLASSVGFAAGLVEAIGAEDGYTARLAAASSVFAGDVGREFGLPEDGVGKLKVAALLQDVGMAGVPDEVFLAPPGKLNSVGRARLERHAVEGERILAVAPGFGEAAKWVRWHHEKVDGTGYPDRLKGPWIPLEARILAAAETYSSMILDTPRSAALTPQEARMELTNLAERSLDAEVIKTLLRVLDREDGNYAAAADNRFAFASPASAEGGDGSPSLRVV